VHTERTRDRGTDGETEQGRGGQKIASLLVPSQLCFDIRDILNTETHTIEIKQQQLIYVRTFGC